MGIFIKNIVVIGAILGVAFLSQQPFFGSNSKNYTYFPEIKNGGNYLKKTGDWFKNRVSSISAKIDNLVGIDGGAVISQIPIEAAKKEIEIQKNNFWKNAVDSSKKFIAKEVLDILHIAPEDLGECKSY